MLVKGFFEIRFDRSHYCVATGMVQCVQMAPGLRVQDRHKLVDIRGCSFPRDGNCFCYDQFPGDTIGGGESGEEFENGYNWGNWELD
jgi:hypothetical protein